MKISKIKLNVVLDIGKTNVKLIFLKKDKIVKEYKTKQQNGSYRNSIKTLKSGKIIIWLIEKLKKELEELKNIKRPKVVQAIAEARAHGDLKENAEYHAAKDEQAKIESRVNEINNLFSRANIIDVTKLEKSNTVIFGSTVSLVDLNNKQKKTYKIVGKDEADLKKNFIYFRSPISKAIIGKNKNDLVEIKTPAGIKNFEIKDVKYI